MLHFLTSRPCAQLVRRLQDLLSRSLEFPTAKTFCRRQGPSIAPVSSTGRSLPLLPTITFSSPRTSPSDSSLFRIRFGNATISSSIRRSHPPTPPARIRRCFCTARTSDSPRCHHPRRLRRRGRCQPYRQPRRQHRQQLYCPLPSWAAAIPDLRRLAVVLDGSVFWPPGSLSFLQGGVWHGGDDLIEHAAVARQRGRDRLGSFVRSSATYRIGAASGAIVELAVRSYDCGRRLVFEQRFPQGLNASSSKPRLATTPSAVVGLAPLSSWPAFELTAGGTARTYAWRSWHGTYGSYSGVGLNSKDTIVFNGVPTMPLLFMSPPITTASLDPTPVCVW